jgi:serine/threonine-protein phosphatase 2B catalytic subunit
MSILRGH